MDEDSFNRGRLVAYQSVSHKIGFALNAIKIMEKSVSDMRIDIDNKISGLEREINWDALRDIGQEH